MAKLLTDLLNGYTLEDLKLFLLQLLSSAFLGLIFYLIFRRKNLNLNLFESLILVIVISFVVSISRNSAPASILCLGIFLIYSNSLKQTEGFLCQLILTSIGFGCGTGNVIVTYIFMLLFVFPLTYLWLYQKSANESK